MLRFIGTVVGALSCAALAWKGFDLSISDLLVRALETYENGLKQAFTIIEPLIKDLLTGWSLQLHPHWKHIFALLWLWFVALAKLTAQHGSFRHLATALLYFLWGGIVALVAAAGAGTVALSDTSSNMLMASFPIGGVVVYSLGVSAVIAAELADPHARRHYGTLEQFRAYAGRTWWYHFRGYARLPLYQAIGGGALLFVGSQSERIPFLSSLPSPGLLVLAAFVVGFAFYAIYLGAAHPEGPGYTWWQRFRNDPSTRNGVEVLTPIVTATIAVLAGHAVGQLA